MNRLKPFRKKRRPGNRPMSPEEAARALLIKEDGFCVACYLKKKLKRRYPQLHHVNGGNIRIGHLASFGLCDWHHQAIPVDKLTHKECRLVWGPSLAEGSVPFERAFGTQIELIELQDQFIQEGF